MTISHYFVLTLHFVLYIPAATPNPPTIVNYKSEFVFIWLTFNLIAAIIHGMNGIQLLDCEYTVPRPIMSSLYLLAVYLSELTQYLFINVTLSVHNDEE